MDYQIIKNVFNRSEAEQIIAFAEVSFHHDDDGHGIESIKPNYLPSVAEKIQKNLIGNIHEKFCSVDPWMKIYNLDSNTAPVPPHVDEDFVASNKLIAKWSVLVYLTDKFLGGETVFKQKNICPHLKAGDVLVFPHNILHQGNIVVDGNKIVLKTDLLFPEF